MSVIDTTVFGRPDSKRFEMLTGFQQKHAQRLMRYDEYWRFYRGLHWSRHRHPDDHFVTMNYCTRIVDIHADFLMKDGFGIVIPDDPESKDFEPATLDFLANALNRVWEQNDKIALCMEMAQMAGVTGDCFMRVSLDNDSIMSPYPRIEVIPSNYVFPTFSGPHGPAQRKLESVLIAYPIYEDAIVDNLMRGFSRNESPNSFDEPTQNVAWHVERWFSDRVVYYHDDGRTETKENPLGVIPIVHIPNYLIAGEFFGRSDLSFVIPLQRELNEKATDVSDVINYHGSPVTIVKGIKVSHLEKGANRTWSIPEHASVENLALNGELDASLNYLGQVRRAMFEIAGIPEQVISPTHQYQSAVSGSLAYSSMINTRKAKIASFSRGITEVNALIVRVLRIIDEGFATLAQQQTDRHLYNTKIVFGEALPRNESIELEQAERRLKIGITSKRYEMEKMGLSRPEIDKIMSDIDKEQESMLELQRKIAEMNAPKQSNMTPTEQQNRSGNPNPNRPNPVLTGENKSITTELNAAKSSKS